MVLVSKIKGNFFLFLFRPWHGWGIEGLGTEGGGLCLFIFYSISLCLLTYLYSSSSVSPLKRNLKNQRDRSVHFFESSSCLTIFISCSDSHESCHSCFSSTHVHGACGESWRFPLKRMQWSGIVTQSSQRITQTRTHTHRWYHCLHKIQLETCTNTQKQQQKPSPEIKHM